MCGIAGFLNYPQGNVEKIQRLLSHRGPDAQTFFRYKGLDLVHTRLSIQDVDQGAQPLIIGDWVIIFNGEIYNHLSLRNKVDDYEFRTQSDTETLLALYIKYGKSALGMCDGMFAFAILDIKSETLFLGRDRAGKKPLYYYKKEKTLVFASELNALSSSVERLIVDDNEIYSYIRNGFFYNDKTPFKDTYEVPSGCIVSVSINDVNLTHNRYFDILEYYQKEKINELDSALSLVDQYLHESIESRLSSSDLEVGAFLSGGIDSSLIVAIASEYVQTLKTFTVKFDGAFDESELAKLTAKKYGTTHTEISISMNLRDDVEKILACYGEPFMDSSAIPSYYVSQAAKEHVSVILNGDGADELFGGYRRYVPVANNWMRIFKYLSPCARFMPQPRRKQSYYNYMYRLLKMSDKKGLEFYNSATNDLFEDLYEFNSNDTFEDMRQFIKQVDQEDISSLSKMLLKDFHLILPNDLLKKMDIATMAHSLEGRSPFLSKYMLELVPTLNDKFKVKGGTTKVILRELGKKYLPEVLIGQPKRGFEVPLTKWVNTELRENILDRVNGDGYSATFLPASFITDLVDKKLYVSDDKRAKMLWTLYCLEVWKENLIVTNNKNSLN